MARTSSDLYNPGGKRVSVWPTYPLDRVKHYWDDVRVPGTQIHQSGIRSPVWKKFMDDGAGSYGVYAWHFENDQRDDLMFSVQLPHTYREGTDIYPHVHWATVSGNPGLPDKDVHWGLEYVWGNVNEAFPSTTSVIDVFDEASVTPYVQQIASFGALTGTDMRISSMLMCRIIRNGNLGEDTYDDDAAFLEVDFHFEVDSPGSVRPFNKVGNRDSKYRL
jgi:hypothetical protein